MRSDGRGARHLRVGTTGVPVVWREASVDIRPPNGIVSRIVAGYLIPIEPMSGEPTMHLFLIPKTKVPHFAGWLDASGQPERGYDSELQAFVRDGRINCCGHPDQVRAGGKICCNAYRYAGRTVAEAREAERRRN
jgi:hypothetical protein